jgi:Fic family protein
VRTYRLIAEVPDDRPITPVLIKHVHASIVSGCDEDHCPPGIIRAADQNVTFGLPKHRGVPGGKRCEDALDCLTGELSTTFRDHDPLIQALALHYHFGAMHPFSDGNGRTARALEALMLQRAGLKDVLFIAMSNYYYEEKRAYLAALAEVRSRDHDLTPFLEFGLRGIALQVGRLTTMLKNAVSKELFRNLMNELFVRLESTRKRVIVKRQLMVLNRLLERDGEVEWLELIDEVRGYYSSRKNAPAAIAYFIQANLDWPSTITETEFFERVEKLPKSKTLRFLSATG